MIEDNVMMHVERDIYAQLFTQNPVIIKIA